MLRSTREGWGSFAKSLHWCVALLILTEVPVGFVMAGTYFGTTGREQR
jgi:cytochrome b561